MRIIGLDPGLRHTGWGIVEVAGSRLAWVADGRISSDDGAGLAARLVQLHDGLVAIIGDFAPAEAAVEETFVNKNPVSTLKLGLARGVVLLVPARAGLPVAEYGANHIKKSVVGAGHAAKEQVQAMVRMLLPGARFSSPDAADALAVAICHAHHRQTETALAAAIAAGAGAWGGRAMIARLSGRIAEIGDDHCILDVGGVGYLLFCSRRTLDRLGTVGAAAALHVETHVREDHIHLYGFIDRSERDWFRLLQTVQGVGGRVALAVLGVLAPERLAGAIAAQDKVPLTRADGVGQKLAARIITELRDKVAAIAIGPAAAGPGAPAMAAPRETGPIADAVSALVNLGYGRADAFAAVATAAGRLGGTGTVEALIPAALKELSR